MPTYTAEQINAAFAVFDTDGNHKISKSEFMAALSRTGPGCSPVDPERALAMWKKFDSNDDGAVSYDEFARAWGGASVAKAPVVTATPELPNRSEEEWKQLILAEDFAAFGTNEPGSDVSAHASAARGVRTHAFTLDTDSLPLPISRRGTVTMGKPPPRHIVQVTIGFLVDFTNKHDCWHYPTWKVVRDIVRPATQATRQRYTDLTEVRVPL